MILACLIFVYVVCAVVSYGLFFGYVQRKYPNIAEEDYLDDMGNSMFFGLMVGFFGPFGILMTVLLTEFGRFGFKFK